MFCPLCKTEYREGFYTCADCSVHLVEELPQIEASQPVISQKDKSRAGFVGKIQFTVLLKTSVAIALICTGFVFSFGAAFFHISEILEGPLGYQGRVAVGMLFCVTALPILGLASLVFSYFIIKKRCQTLKEAIILATSSLLLCTIPFILGVTSQYMRELILIYPAVLLARIAGSYGFFVGSVIQIIIGGLMLGWFERRTKAPEETCLGKEKGTG